MKQLVHFLFPFLFTRNWHTGELEWSPSRLFWFLLAVGFVAAGLLAVFVLQLPITYSAS